MSRAFRTWPLRVRPAWGVAALLLAALSACALSDKRIYNLDIYRSDPKGYLSAGGMDSNAIATIVSGNPFGIDQERLAAIVAASIQTGVTGQNVRFAIHQGDTVRRDVTMAVAFDPPISTSGQVLCQSGGRAGSQPNSESIRVVMAFCLSDRPLVSIEGKLNRRAGAGDAAFVSLIRDMTRRMFETAPPKTP